MNEKLSENLGSNCMATALVVVNVYLGSKHIRRLIECTIMTKEVRGLQELPSVAKRNEKIKIEMKNANEK